MVELVNNGSTFTLVRNKETVSLFVSGECIPLIRVKAHKDVCLRGLGEMLIQKAFNENIINLTFNN